MCSIISSVYFRHQLMDFTGATLFYLSVGMLYFGKDFNCAHLEGKMEMTFFYLKNPCSIMLSKKLLITSLYNYINIIKRSH